VTYASPPHKSHSEFIDFKYEGNVKNPFLQRRCI